MAVQFSSSAISSPIHKYVWQKRRAIVEREKRVVPEPFFEATNYGGTFGNPIERETAYIEAPAEYVGGGYADAVDSGSNAGAQNDARLFWTRHAQHYCRQVLSGPIITYLVSAGLLSGHRTPAENSFVAGAIKDTAVNRIESKSAAYITPIEPPRQNIAD